MMRNWSVKKKLFSVLLVVVCGFIFLLILNGWSKNQLLAVSAEKGTASRKITNSDSVVVAIGEAQRNAAEMLLLPSKEKADKVFVKIDEVHNILAQMEKGEEAQGEKE